MKLPALTQIELDVSHWDPRPNDVLQRMLLHDLRVYCPTLQHIVFWISQHRFHWYMRGGQWLNMHQVGRLQIHDNLWRT